MFIRFEIDGRPIPDYWEGPTEHCRGSYRFPDPPWRLRARTLRHGAADEYFWLLHRLTYGVPWPRARTYTVPPGYEAVSFLRVNESMEDRVAAGWRLVALLRAHGWPAYEVFAHTPPGRVVYKDEFQIIVRRRVRVQKQPGWTGDRTTIRRWAADSRRIRSPR